MMDLWTKLTAESRPIVIYGMGNGADKVTDELARRGVLVADYFASDAFVRGQFFRGKRVLTFAEIKEKYADFVILVGFASAIPAVMEQIYQLDREYELYVPDVPVVGEGVFDSAFWENNRSFIQEARGRLFDEKSRELFDQVIAYKLSGKLTYLARGTSSPEEVLKEVLHPDRYRFCADLGAYNGDSVREFMACFPNLSHILSMEPDRRNFKKLSRFVEEEGLSFVEIHNAAAGNYNGEAPFSASGNRNARADARGRETVNIRTLDSLLRGEQVDYIKYDVEGSEYEALQGSLRSIKQYTPDLLVSLYHRNEDIFKLILYVASLNKEYRLFLRRFSYIPAWDLNLYAVT